MRNKKNFKCIECKQVGQAKFKMHARDSVLVLAYLLTLTLVFSFPFIGIPLGIGIYFYFRMPHCSSCGSLLIELESERNTEFDPNAENEAKEFEINPIRGVDIDWGWLISGLSAEQLKYNQLRGIFVNKSRVAASRFQDNYEREIKNLDMLIEKSTSIATKYILEAIDDAIKILISMEIYDVDKELFLRDYYQPHDRWLDVFNPIADKYAEIIFNAEQLNEYRMFRSQNRTQIIGGGFGIEGAVQGLAVAGAANLAIGAVHGIINVIEKSFNNINDLSKKNLIFSDPLTKFNLVDGLRFSVLSVHLALLDILKKHACGSSYQSVSKDMIEKSQRILNNVKASEITDEEKLKILKEILQINPYNEDTYEYILEKFGDLNRKLEFVAEFFFINLKSIKHNNIWSKVDTSSEDSVQAAVKLVKELGIYYESISVESILIDLRKKLIDFDIQARTVAGKLYPTRRMAELAKTKLKCRPKHLIISFFGLAKIAVKGIIIIFAILLISIWGSNLWSLIFSPDQQTVPSLPSVSTAKSKNPAMNMLAIKSVKLSAQSIG